MDLKIVAAMCYKIITKDLKLIMNIGIPEHEIRYYELLVVMNGFYLTLLWSTR